MVTDGLWSLVMVYNAQAYIAIEFDLEFDYGTLTVGLWLWDFDCGNLTLGGSFFSLDKSSFGLKLSLYPKFQLPMCPGTVLIFWRTQL